MALSQGLIPLIAGLGSGIIGVRAPFVAGGILMITAWISLFVFKKRSV
jgi:hypothetical protein